MKREALKCYKIALSIVSGITAANFNVAPIIQNIQKEAEICKNSYNEETGSECEFDDLSEEEDKSVLDYQP